VCGVREVIEAGRADRLSTPEWIAIVRVWSEPTDDVIVSYGCRSARRRRGAAVTGRAASAWANTAPRSRDRLREFYHFCLDHVRAYNQAWDFFAGMSRAEIEAYLREDVTWHRPTWPFGNAGRVNGEGWRWQDPFHVFTDGGGGTNGTHGAAEWDQRPAKAGKTERMLEIMELSIDATRDDLKARYKQLVKRHHPDLHGGDKKAEERLKLINEAYTYLLDRERFV